MASEEPDALEEANPVQRKLPAGLPGLKAPPAGTRSKDLLNFYLSEVRRYPLLSAEEEKVYANRFVESEGEDREAAERLVTANLRLVIKIAFQYHRQWANVLDLIQEGNVGLVEALSRYDPSREIRFSSYAQYWIRAMILRFLLDNFRLVRLGSTRAGRKLFFQLQKERDRLLREG
ncbi:MAG: sigma-70 family RNA polymerase sigma factor, partial [Myxococcota bacterium]